MKTFYIITMGCQMNEYDSDFLARTLSERGLKPTREPQKADLVLINTCTVRAKAEQKALSQIGRLSSWKKARPSSILAVVGCLAQREGKILLERFPQVDLVIGPRELGRIWELLGAVSATGQKRRVALQLDRLPPEPEEFFGGCLRNRVSGSISIMQGCNNFCSYCIVPYVRGREVSRTPEAILREARFLLEQGAKEVLLLGQNVNSYRWRGNREKWDFPKLLREISRLKGLQRLRFTTSHPKDLSEDLIRCFGELGNLCGHIHLPFQAGSNAILEAMRRGYTRERYLALVDKLREVRSDLAITGDVMVGFPGETREDFQQTLDLMRRVRFDALFSFKYSDRRGTVAEKWGPKVREEEKGRRLRVLQSLQREITLEKNRRLEGQTVEVLVEGLSKRGGQLAGRTETNKIVNFNGNIKDIGKIIQVKIKHAYVNSLKGESCHTSCGETCAETSLPGMGQAVGYKS